MLTKKLTRDEVIEQAERFVFEQGGWLFVGNRMGMTGEALRRKFRSTSVVDMRGWLSAMRNTIGEREENV